MSVTLNGLNWSPVVEDRTVVMFVTTAMSCVECARAVAGLSEAFVQDKTVRDIVGGRIGNVHWRTKGMDVADHCDLCEEGGYGRQLYEELRFWVEVSS